MAKKKKIKEAPPREPLILAIESATGVSSVALFEADRLLGVVDLHANRLHAKLVTVLVERLLSDLSVGMSEVAAIAVAAGPGSYTGLRVGVSIAKGLAMALDKPLLSVGSLEALATSVQDMATALDAWICPMIDARRMEVFCAIYDAELMEMQPTEAKIIEEDAFADQLRERRILFVGDGAAKCKAILTAQSSHAIVLEKRLSSAAGMGEIAWKKYLAGDFEDLVTFEPFYLKNFVATKPKNKIL